MNKIEAIIRHERLQEVQDALDELGVSGLTVERGHGLRAPEGLHRELPRLQANISLLPKLKIESVVPAAMTDAVVEAIVAAAYTGETGDGRLFVIPVAQAVRIRTGESGEETVRHEEPVGWGS